MSKLPTKELIKKILEKSRNLKSVFLYNCRKEVPKINEATVSQSITNNNLWLVSLQIFPEFPSAEADTICEQISQFCTREDENLDLALQDMYSKLEILEGDYLEKIFSSGRKLKRDTLSNVKDILSKVKNITP